LIYRIDSLVNAIKEKHKLVGLSISIDYQDKLIYDKALEFSNIEENKAKPNFK
jgi:hypothetical protein